MREVHDSDLARDLPRILFDAARCEQTSILDESGKIAMVVGTGDLRIEDDGEDEPPDRESYEWVSWVSWVCDPQLRIDQPTPSVSDRRSRTHETPETH